VYDPDVADAERPGPTTAIVTGAAHGIGAALVRRLAKRGLNVVLVDRDTEAMAAVAAGAGLGDANALVVRADVAQEDDVENYVTTTVDAFGRIDYFANNAGIESPFGMIEDQSVDALDTVYAVNVRGVFLGLNKVLPVMKAQGSGAVVNTSSLAGLMGAPGVSPYVMSKHAVIGLTRSAAAEAGPFGVRVNAVLPGSINTGMMRRIEDSSGTPDDYKAAIDAAIPFNRYGEPDEVAAVMSFLLSEDSSYVTASFYTVDGGLMQQ
jgi:NAD(P)-dependent dehydrogenase (short-subunit alcohol dehydrogenase family)